MCTTLTPQTLPVNVDRSSADYLDALEEARAVTDILAAWEVHKAQKTPQAADTQPTDAAEVNCTSPDDRGLHTASAQWNTNRRPVRTPRTMLVPVYRSENA